VKNLYQFELRRSRNPAQRTNLPVQMSIGHILLHQLVRLCVEDFEFSVGTTHREQTQVVGECGMTPRRHVAAFSVGRLTFLSVRRPLDDQTAAGGVRKRPTRRLRALRPRCPEIWKSSI
jgi:hypothetical protein